MRAVIDEERQDPRLIPPNTFIERAEVGLRIIPRLLHIRQRGEAIARVTTVRPSAGEVYYIRAILLHRPIQNWIDMRTTPDGLIHATFKLAAAHEGLIEHDNEANAVILKAISLHVAPADLRFLFGLLINKGTASNSLQLWHAHASSFARDFLPLQFSFLADAPPATRALAKRATLDAIDKVLYSFGLSNSRVGLPNATARDPLTDEERDFFEPQQLQLRTHAAHSRAFFTEQQHTIIEAVLIHKRFIIPVIEDDDQNQARPPLRSGLHSNSGQAALLREASLLIIDEVWALPAEVLEAVDDVLQDVMGSDEPFGGKVVLAVGDPRQTAPVTKENTEQATLEASFLTSPLFAHFKVHELQQAQRQAGDPALSAWVDRIGDDYSRNSIDPTTFFDNVDSLQLAKDFLFPPDVLSNPRSVISRCFLTPLNINVDEFNDMVLDDLPGEYSMSSASTMDQLRNTNFVGFVQFDKVKKVSKTGSGYWNTSIRFALNVADTAIVSADATAYSATAPEVNKLYYITASWIGTARPTLSIHTFMEQDDTSSFDAPSPIITGVGRVPEVHKTELKIRIQTAGYDRESNSRTRTDLNTNRTAERRWKGVPWPEVGADVFFVGKLHSQTTVGSRYEILIEDMTWANQSSNNTSNGNAQQGSSSSSSARPFLGKRRRTETTELTPLTNTSSSPSLIENILDMPAYDSTSSLSSSPSASTSRPSGTGPLPPSGSSSASR
ncbi:unnamed protein product [Tilletia caries]|nr:unnamed protein product [Tilletia caries]